MDSILKCVIKALVFIIFATPVFMLSYHIEITSLNWAISYYITMVSTVLLAYFGSNEVVNYFYDKKRNNVN